ncbi:Hypothetical protein SMAX5B_007061 [Scophthalmus maximus]|uniref:Uncharacterized protein n=1 Tax=Scophthalmus maximus TaxID=52904 RepID=A0A2U9B0D2_SCOMX|nr:Hypothetical protein SMAX5B_007061 [Scophthalmus maximus]
MGHRSNDNDDRLLLAHFKFVSRSSRNNFSELEVKNCNMVVSSSISRTFSPVFLKLGRGSERTLLSPVPRRGRATLKKSPGPPVHPDPLYNFAGSSSGHSRILNFLIRHFLVRTCADSGVMIASFLLLQDATEHPENLPVGLNAPDSENLLLRHYGKLKTRYV